MSKSKKENITSVSYKGATSYRASFPWPFLLGRLTGYNCTTFVSLICNSVCSVILFAYRETLSWNNRLYNLKIAYISCICTIFGYKETGNLINISSLNPAYGGVSGLFCLCCVLSIPRVSIVCLRCHFHSC